MLAAAARPAITATFDPTKAAVALAGPAWQDRPIRLIRERPMPPSAQPARHSYAVIALAATLLAGCAPRLPIVDIEALPPEQRHATRTLPVYDRTHLIDREVEVLGVVEGYACQRRMLHPPASETTAVEQLKYRAAELGADGIRDIQCAVPMGPSTRTYCWGSVSCTAEAIRVRGRR